MTEAQILLLIQTVIIANGNNEITADVLRPVLIEMLQQPNALIGDLDTLQTSDKTNLVNAINEVLGTNTGGLTILTGTTDPNVTPPIGTINIGDFYVWNDGTLKGFYQYNGSEWAIIKNLNIPNDLVSADASNGVEIGSDGKLFVNKFSESIPIENTYATIDGVSGMLDSQTQQTTGFIQKVLDASFDGITGIAYYEKKASSTADLSDYDRITGNPFDPSEIYLPLTGGTLTGSLSAPNFETEKGIEFLSNIELSKLLESGELAVRITDTGVPIYIFNATGTPTNPKDVITKEFFDANAGGDNVIEVTVDTIRNTPTKSGFTSSGNYVPNINDIIYVEFSQGNTNINSLAIDGGTRYNVRFSGNILAADAISSTFDRSVLPMFFDGNFFVPFGSTKSFLNSDLAVLMAGVSTAERTWRSIDLTDWIDQKYVPMFGFKTQTIVLTPLGEDLTVGLCEYVYTVQDDVLLVSYPTNVQSPSSGVAVETVIRRNGSDIDALVRSVIPAGHLDTFASGGSDGVFDPPVQLTKGDKLSFYVDASGSAILAQCLTVTLNFQ